MLPAESENDALTDGRAVRLTPKAHFNHITPYCTNPNLTLTSLNTAVQTANLIMYRGHVWTYRRTGGQTDGHLNAIF